MKKIPTFYHLVRPSHSSIKKILLKMFAMLIKNSLYISGVFIKISKNVFKNGLQQQQKRFKQHIHLNFSLKGHLFECFISLFMLCFRILYLNRILKQKKNLLCRRRRK